MSQKLNNERVRYMPDAELEKVDRELDRRIPVEQSFHAAVKREIRARSRRVRKASQRADQAGAA